MLATVATQPLIVAKVGLQSKPPPARNGKPFKSFTEVMQYIIQHEGPMALFKGIGPQILKGLLVQGFLMMTKERYAHQRLLCNSTLTRPAGSSCLSSCSSDISDRFGRRSYRSLPTLLHKRLAKSRRFSSNEQAHGALHKLLCTHFVPSVKYLHARDLFGGQMTALRECCAWVISSVYTAEGFVSSSRSCLYILQLVQSMAFCLN
jgi:hypothetical protein